MTREFFTPERKRWIADFLATNHTKNANANSNPQSSALPRFSCGPRSGVVSKSNLDSAKLCWRYRFDGRSHLRCRGLDRTKFVGRELQDRNSATAKILLIRQALIGSYEQIKLRLGHGTHSSSKIFTPAGAALPSIPPTRAAPSRG